MSETLRPCDHIRRPYGTFAMRVWRRGQLVEQIREPNLVVSGMPAALAQLLGGSGGVTPIQIGFGSNGTPPAEPDAALTDAYVRTVVSVAFPVAGQVTFNWKLAAAEAIGLSIREWGLLTAGGVLIARKTRAAIEKAGDISLDGAWTIQFD